MGKLKRFFTFALFISTIAIYSCSNENSSVSEYLIKDITAASIYAPLEEKGFNIDKQFGGDDFFVDCSNPRPYFTEHVRIYGTSPDKISEIRASYTKYSKGNINELAIPFLGFIATLPYENSNPQKAQKWLMDNISKKTKIEINGVKFELLGNSKNIRTLLITPAK